MRASAGAAAFLAACGRSDLPDNPAVGDAIGSGADYSGPPVELSYWNGFTGGDGPLMLDLVEKFNAEHPNINVKMNLVRWEDYYQKVPAAVYSGRGPDVGIMHIDQLATNAAHKVIVPIDEVSDVLGLQEDDFAPVVWEGLFFNGRRYGIPLDMHPLGFYYNKALLEQAGLDPDAPPRTRDEYMTALDRMKGEGIQGYWVSPFLFTGGLTFQALLWQFGGELYSEDASRATFNSDAGVEALTWLVDMIREGYSPSNVGQDAENTAFINGQNAFMWTGPWSIGQYAGVPDFQWAVAEVPQIGSRQATWANAHNFVIINNRNPDRNRLQASTTFVGWMSDNSLAWADAGMVPARSQVRESPGFQKLKEQAVFAEEIPYLHFPPAAPGIPDAQLTLETAVNEAILMTKSPAEALDSAALIATDRLTEALQRYGDLDG